MFIKKKGSAHQQQDQTKMKHSIILEETEAQVMLAAKKPSVMTISSEGGSGKNAPRKSKVLAKTLLAAEGTLAVDDAVMRVIDEPSIPQVPKCASRPASRSRISANLIKEGRASRKENNAGGAAPVTERKNHGLPKKCGQDISNLLEIRHGGCSER